MASRIHLRNLVDKPLIMPLVLRLKALQGWRLSITQITLDWVQQFFIRADRVAASVTINGTDYVYRCKE